MLSLEVHRLIKDVYDEIVSLPFYQDGNKYKYAKHLLTNEGTSSKYLEFLETNPETIIYPTGVQYDEYLKFFNESINSLTEIEISQQEYEDWLFNQEESKEINKYKDIIHSIHGELNRLSYIEVLGDYFPQETDSQAFDKVLSYGGDRGSSILTDINEATEINNGRGMGQKVLNKNNPFADVSIEDQKFLYATDTGSFKVLELNTSYTLTNIQKDDEKSFLALQPGFKIRISSKLSEDQASDIVFDDTLTTEIAQDDKVYIYLDGLQN